MKKISVRDVTVTALFSAVITLSAWISIPFPVPLTMQIFAVVVTSVALGLKRSVASVLVYLLLGALGLPVFSGFKGGLSVLFGATGGFLFGLLAIAILVGYSTQTFNKKSVKIFLAVFSLLICWFLGAVWYSKVYSVSFFGVLYLFVFPYIIPDIAKTVFGYYVGGKIRIFIKKL